jgi:2-C-methyl-D-erythritol 4-phosphate cytidylyltransferase
MAQLTMKTIAIVPAAGTGERMGNNRKKPYLLLNERPLLYYTLTALASTPSIAQIIVAVAPGDEEFCQQQVLEKFHFKKNIQIIAGGSSRQESVSRLLERVPDEAHLVLVHDGARPLITSELLEQAIAETRVWKATVLAVPVKDTIKAANDALQIEKTISRERLWAIQTPQTFERSIIGEAHRRARQQGFIGTDDAALVERIGVQVKIVMGSYDNIKVTTPEDLIVAEALLKKRRNNRRDH